MNYSVKTPTFYSMFGSLAFHMVFVMFVGHYIVSQEQIVPLVKKSYKLEVVEKKKLPPVEKKKIRKMVKKKQIRVLPVIPRVLPQVQTRAQVMQVVEVARVTPLSVTLESIPLLSTPTVSKKTLVQTASASLLNRSYSAAPRQFQATQKVQTEASGGRLIKRGVQKASVPVFQVRAIQSDSSQRGGKGVVKTAFVSESIGRFSTDAFQPRPVPNILDQGALRGYTRGVQRKIAARKEYPLRAKRNGMEGQITVQFTVLKSGDVKNLKLVSKTPYDILNEAALKAVKQAAPFPGLPEGIGWDFLELELPFKFELKK